MAGKTRYDLVPFEAIAEIADVLEYGAQKYSANNWCRGADWSRYFAALCRHVFAWWNGEDRDPETGFSHLAHAGCCLVFLMQYQRHSWGTDDRFTGPDDQPFRKADGRPTPDSAARACWVDATGKRCCQQVQQQRLHSDDDGNAD